MVKGDRALGDIARCTRVAAVAGDIEARVEGQADAPIDVAPHRRLAADRQCARRCIERHVLRAARSVEVNVRVHERRIRVWLDGHARRRHAGGKGDGQSLAQEAGAWRSVGEGVASYGLGIIHDDEHPIAERLVIDAVLNADLESGAVGWDRSKEVGIELEPARPTFRHIQPSTYRAAPLTKRTTRGQEPRQEREDDPGTEPRQPPHERPAAGERARSDGLGVAEIRPPPRTRSPS